MIPLFEYSCIFMVGPIFVVVCERVVSGSRYLHDELPTIP